MHVELDISGSRLNYVAGDHLAIFPINDPQLVEQIGDLLDVDLNTVITLTSIDGRPTLFSIAIRMYISRADTENCLGLASQSVLRTDLHVCHDVIEVSPGFCIYT